MFFGTMILLNAAKKLWKDNYEGKRFYHASIDEVYGSLGVEGVSTEITFYYPNSPY
jgi:dTDP-glucose 4,6-dehydratase